MPNLICMDWLMAMASNSSDDMTMHFSNSVKISVFLYFHILVSKDSAYSIFFSISFQSQSFDWFNISSTQCKQIIYLLYSRIIHIFNIVGNLFVLKNQPSQVLTYDLIIFQFHKKQRSKLSYKYYLDGIYYGWNQKNYRFQKANPLFLTNRNSV